MRQLVLGCAYVVLALRLIEVFRLQFVDAIALPPNLNFNVINLPFAEGALFQSLLAQVLMDDAIHSYIFQLAFLMLRSGILSIVLIIYCLLFLLPPTLLLLLLSKPVPV